MLKMLRSAFIADDLARWRCALKEENCGLRWLFTFAGYLCTVRAYEVPSHALIVAGHGITANVNQKPALSPVYGRGLNHPHVLGITDSCLSRPVPCNKITPSDCRIRPVGCLGHRAERPVFGASDTSRAARFWSVGHGCRVRPPLMLRSVHATKDVRGADHVTP